jgi:hypothetical protein
MAAMAAILDLVSVGYLMNAWVDWSDFLCGLLGVIRGRFLSMTTTAAAMVAILDLVSVDFLTNA